VTETSYDLIVIGGGPGGYVAAIRAAQLGMKVACVDKNQTLGGTCLRVGCIPSKALLYSSFKYLEAQTHFQDYGVLVSSIAIDLKKMMARKEKIVTDLTQGISFLFKKNKVDSFQGTAKFLSAGEITVEGDQTLKAPHIIICTGSEPTTLAGLEIDEKHIVSSTGALALEKVPDHLVVIGGGYIGLELGSVWRRLGSKVTVIEFIDRVVPMIDHEIGTALLRSLKKQGLEFMFSTQVTQVKKQRKDLEVTWASTASNKTGSLTCDAVLSCVGRQPYTKGLGLEKIGLTLDEKGYIPVDENFKTRINGVYAIGDVTQGPMLAHRAEEEGIACVEKISGQRPSLNKHLIPSVVYTHPEVASVGKTEEDLKKGSIAYKKGIFPFAANARALINEETEGFVKILTNARTDEILGVHIFHADAGTLISECVLAMEYRASAEDIARTCHAHPTLNEAVKEGALAAYEKAIHV
jgi:dihydrolipoamide dehydrogenase